MAKRSSSFLGDVNCTTLRTIICFILLKFCSARNVFDNLDLSSQTLNPTVTGFMVTGNAAGDGFGYSVSTAGDINNDGYDDIIIGAYMKNSNQGAVYVIYGGEESSFLNIDLSVTTLNPLTTGFMITGDATSSYFGYSVSTAGDIDNDGYDDIIVGAYSTNKAYVIYGGAKSAMSNIALSSTTLSPTSTGFMITGSSGGGLGVSVSTAGDINNDGYDDIIVGAPWKNTLQGGAYVIYGGTKSSMSNWDFSSGATLTPLTTGFLITGNAAGDYFGYSVSTAGDINNDGYDDIIVGAIGQNSYQGAVNVIYGGEKSTRTNIVLSSTTLDPTSMGFMITGNAVGDYFGNTVSTAGDINNDGYDDIIIGAFSKNSNQGAVYVIYGGPKSEMSNWDFSSGATLTPSTTGFMITGNAALDNFGYSVSTAGDINKDGYDDIIVGADYKNSIQGAAYVIYGGDKSAMTNIVLSSTTLIPTSTGFTITGNAAGDYFGVSVSTAGDFNNDGYPDIIVGAYQMSTNNGAAYVIYDSCSINCKQCFSDSICSECKNSYLMYQYACYNPCPDTTLATSSTTCDDCPTRCKHCSSTSICTECLSPFVLYDSQCLTSCPITMFSSNKICKNCPSYCDFCASQDTCQVCFEGYTLSNSLCVLSSDLTQQKVLKAVSSATQGIGSVVSVGSSVFPFSALVSKIVQNTRYLNLSVTSDLAEVYQTWSTDFISWDVPNIMSDLDHFETSPYLFAQYNIDSPFLVNFWPTLINIAIGFGTFLACILLKKVFEHEKYEGWAYSLVLKLVAGSFNFALIQAYACMDDILFYLVLDAKSNPFNSFFSWTSMICAIIFLALGCLQVFFNFWTVYKYQSIKNQGTQEIEAFTDRNKYWGLFYSDFNDDDLWSQCFFAIAIIRSVLSNLIISVLYDYPLLQTSYFLIMDAAIILFLYFKTPFNTLRGTLAQYYYEIITLLVHLCAFIMGLQDSFDNPSDTVRKIMSTGILYLNTALICGAVGFMFIELYKTISEKKRAARLKQHQSIPEESQEIQNLNQPADRLNSSEAIAQKRQYWTNRQHASVENDQNLNRVTSSQGYVDNSGISDMNASHRINHYQRNQSPMPQNLHQRLQRNNPKNPNYRVNYE